jgi:hypothetical protein
VTGLEAGATYTVCLLARNGTKIGENEAVSTPPVTFTTATPAEKPETKPASGETGSTAILHGVLNPKAEAETGWYFAYSTGAECTSGGPGSGETAHEPPAKAKALSVEREAAGLEPNKAYKFCLVATNTAEESTPGTEVSLKTLPLPPVIASESASSVKSTGATLEAQINPNNEKTKYTFEYSTSENGAGVLTGTIVKVSGAELEGFPERLASVALSGLKAGKTYYYGVVAENKKSEEESKPVVFPVGSVQSFTTVPTPSAEPVSAITATTATFNGKLDPLNPNVTTQYHFNYKISNSECAGENGTPGGEAGTGAGTEVAKSVNVTGLQPNAEYTVCFAANNQFGESESTAVHFTTLAVPPRIASETVSGVTPVEATLEAEVNPNNQPTASTFEYASSEAAIGTVGATKLVGGLLTGFGEQPVSVALAGLQVGATYYYRVVVENTATKAVVNGAIKSFTPQGPPLVSIGEAQDVTSSTAILSGAVNPAGTETTYHFIYAPAFEYTPGAQECAAKPVALCAYGPHARVTPRSSSVGSDYTAHATGPIPISELQPGTTYDYVLVATSAQETTVISANGSFTTGPATTEPPSTTEQIPTTAPQLPASPFTGTPTPAFIPYTSIAVLDATEAHENKGTGTTKKTKKSKKKKHPKHKKHDQKKKK